MIPPETVVLMLLSLTLGGVVFLGFFIVIRQRKGLNGHADKLVDRVTAMLGESELRMAKRLAEFRAELAGLYENTRADMDSLHRRVEFLEEKDRRRP